MMASEVQLGDEALITVEPGQKYVATVPLPGILTCLRCGSLIDEQLADVHDDQAHT